MAERTDLGSDDVSERPGMAHVGDARTIEGHLADRQNLGLTFVSDIENI